MSDTGASPGAGWFYAEGDPPGTQRYWDGAAWQGAPQVIQPPPSPLPPPTPQATHSAQSPLTQSSFGSPSFAAPTVEKKRSRWRLVVGLIFGLMLLIGGCTFFLWRAVSGPIDAGNEFLAAVQGKDFDEAWELSDASCFDNAGPGAIEEIFGPVVIESYRLTSSNVDVSNGEQSGSTSGEITFGGGDTRTIELFMVESDGWLVCGFDVGSAPGG